MDGGVKMSESDKENDSTTESSKSEDTKSERPKEVDAPPLKTATNSYHKQNISSQKEDE